MLACEMHLMMKSNRNYPLLLAGQFLSALGDNAILAVIVGQLTYLQKAGTITATELRTRNTVYTSLLFVPYVLLAPLAGYLNDRLMLVTDDVRGEQIPVLVEGQVLPSITVSPTALFMGVVPSGQKVTRQLMVSGKKPFRILEITCDDKSFKFDTSKDNAAKELHLVPVTFLAGADAGKVVKTIKIKTDQGEMTPELAAYAVVAAAQ